MFCKDLGSRHDEHQCWVRQQPHLSVLDRTSSHRSTPREPPPSQRPSSAQSFMFAACRRSTLLPMTSSAQPVAATGHQSQNSIPAAPEFSVPGGSYDKPISLRLTAKRGETIRYTTDGTIPTKSSRSAENSAIQVSSNTSLTAVAFKGNTAAEIFKSSETMGC